VTILLSLNSEDNALSFVSMIKNIELGLYDAVSKKYSYDIKAKTAKGFVRSVSSYWVYEEYFNASQLAASFVEGTDALVSVTYDNTANEDKINGLVDFVDKTTKDLLSSHGLSGVVSYGVTGIAPFATAILDGVADDLHFMDEAVLPLAMLILSAVIGSATLMIIPICNILITILAEFLVMYPVALSMDVVSFTPSLMMSITIAMSIDYSLFLLSRFMEEIGNGRSVEEAIPFMVDGAGHTILVSGGTLICCFLGMLLFPMAMLQSVGIGASVTLFFALSVNLTLTPALLFTVGERLIKGQERLERCWRRLTCRAKTHSESSLEAAAAAGPLSSPLMDSDAFEDEETETSPASGSNNRHLQLSKASADFSFSDDGHGDLKSGADEFSRDLAMSKSVWYKLAWFLLNPWRGGICVLAATCALAAPVCMHALSVDMSISFDMSVPSGSKTYETFKDIEKGFGAGAVFPYSLLFVPKNSSTMDPCQGAVFDPGTPSLCSLSKLSGELSDDTKCRNGFMCPLVFDSLNSALQTLETNGEQDSEIAQFAGITALDGSPVMYADYVAALEREKGIRGQKLTSFDRSILLLYESFCEVTNHTAVMSASSPSPPSVNLCAATYFTVMLSKDPFSTEGVDWLKEARKTLDDLSGEDGALFDFYLGYGAGTTYDVTTAVYDSFPLIIGVTLATVFVLMGVAFRSLVAPVRSVLTLALTLAFVYGLLVLVYQKGAFGFLGLRCFENSHAVSWLPPVMSFSIIVGLGLDYDVFLISRVHEFRLEGNTDHAAAVKGICATGYIITAAGLIMAVAFGGLLTSDELLLNQTAFLLVFAVLLDTFVVRTLCVPALLGITDTLSWWPSKMPPATKSIGL